MYRAILVPLDGSETANGGLREAIKLSQSLQATLRLLCIANETDLALAEAAYPNADLLNQLHQAGETVLRDGEREVRAAGLTVSSVLLDTSTKTAGELIIEQAHEWPCDLIVMGTHGRRGLHRLVLGSSAEFVLRHTPVPVLMVRRRHIS
ncbi:MAG: universal stress protein [Steroidobacteraceae bacterium]